MVRRTTEYRTNYKKGNTRKVRQSADLKASYCILRRHSEHRHTPLNWDEDWEDIESTPRGVIEHVYKHEKYNDMYDQKREQRLEERLARLQLEEVVGRGYKKGAGSTSPTVGTTPPSLSSSGGTTPVKKKRVRSCSACEADEQMEQVAQDIESPPRHDRMKDVIPPRRKPTYKKPIPKPRSMSAPIGRPPKKEKMSPSQGSPFVPYGFKAKSRETGRKRTHNIKAQSQVYPAALRAYRRREMEIEKREEAAENMPYRVVRHKALFNDNFGRKPTTWDTEYRQSYVGYDEGLYRHNVMQRHDPKLAWQAYVVP